jgi:hypothetical protein
MANLTDFLDRTRESQVMDHVDGACVWRQLRDDVIHAYLHIAIHTIEAQVYARLEKSICFDSVRVCGHQNLLVAQIP